MRPTVTRTQRRILDAIADHIRTHGWPPTIREIGDAAGLYSTSSVTHQLRQLEWKGYIHRDPSKPRAIRIIEHGAEAS